MPWCSSYHYPYRIQMYFGTIWKVCAHKRFMQLFSHNISRKNWMKHSQQILLKYSKNLFKRRKYPPPNAFNIKYFWTHPQLQQLGLEGVGVGTIYPIFNFKKTVYPKNLWMQHWVQLHSIKPELRFCAFSMVQLWESMTMFPAGKMAKYLSTPEKNISSSLQS